MSSKLDNDNCLRTSGGLACKAIRCIFVIILLLQFPHREKAAGAQKQCFENIHRNPERYKDTNVHKVATPYKVLRTLSPCRTKVPALTATSQTGIETGDFLATPHSLDLELGLDSPFPAKKTKPKKKTGKRN